MGHTFLMESSLTFSLVDGVSQAACVYVAPIERHAIQFYACSNCKHCMCLRLLYWHQPQVYEFKVERDDYTMTWTVVGFKDNVEKFLLGFYYHFSGWAVVRPKAMVGVVLCVGSVQARQDCGRD